MVVREQYVGLQRNSKESLISLSPTHPNPNPNPNPNALHHPSFQLKEGEKKKKTTTPQPPPNCEYSRRRPFSLSREENGKE